MMPTDHFIRVKCDSQFWMLKNDVIESARGNRKIVIGLRRLFCK